jgi:hypothetical protein
MSERDEIPKSAENPDESVPDEIKLEDFKQIDDRMFVWETRRIWRSSLLTLVGICVAVAAFLSIGGIERRTSQKLEITQINLDETRGATARCPTRPRPGSP